MQQERHDKSNLESDELFPVELSSGFQSRVQGWLMGEHFLTLLTFLMWIWISFSLKQHFKKRGWCKRHSSWFNSSTDGKLSVIKLKSCIISCNFLYIMNSCWQRACLCCKKRIIDIGWRDVDEKFLKEPKMYPSSFLLLCKLKVLSFHDGSEIKYPKLLRHLM